MNKRYHRQILLPEIGEEGQRKLKQARVLLVGIGGLGCPISLYLTAAGVSCIGLVDPDVVSATNLGRQVLYQEDEIGLPKVKCAARRLKAQNGQVRLMEYPFKLTSENAESLIADYDIVVDGCDNHATRYLISDTCHRLQKPYVYAAIGAFQGQVGILCHNKKAATYRTLFPDEKVMCALHAEKGVIGTTPAVVGSVAANEVLKLIIGHGEPLLNRIWYIDLLNLKTQLIQL